MSTTETIGLPKEFGSEPLTGFRTWCVLSSTNDGESFLLDWNSQFLWAPFEPAVATCKLGRRHDVTPDENCSCGFYAVKSPEWLFRQRMLYRGGVYGEVAMWGKVIETDQGNFRAQFCYPKRLVVVDTAENAPLVLQLTATYGVPVEFESWDRWHDIWQEADERARLPKGTQSDGRRTRRGPQAMLKQRRDELNAAHSQLWVWQDRVSILKKEVARLEAACNPTTEL